MSPIVIVVLLCVVLYCTVLAVQQILLLQYCEAQARVRQGGARDGP